MNLKHFPFLTYYCVRYLGSFDYYGHICLKFELLGPSVFNFMDRNKDRPFEIDQLRRIAYQLCKSVEFFHTQKLTHTDLKPENFCFIASNFMKSGGHIRLVDFGSAVFNHQPHPATVTTRNYRAPEIILQIKCAQPSDV